MKEVIYTDNAPKPVGPYSQGIYAGGFLFIAGQIPLDPKTNQLVTSSFEEQVRRVLDNIKAIVEAAGGTMDNIVKVTVYLRDLGRYGEFNEIYKEYFTKEPPARAVIGVANLPKGVELEVEAIAYICK